eukprot:11207253-Lingulodinium_polyedra.AAC.1
MASWKRRSERPKPPMRWRWRSRRLAPRPHRQRPAPRPRWPRASHPRAIAGPRGPVLGATGPPLGTRHSPP